MLVFATILALCSLAASVTVSYADACSAIASQLRNSGSGGNSAQVAALRRQLVALKGLERQRRCSGGGSGGFFDACGDIASRQATVQRQIAEASGVRDASRLRARYASLGCDNGAARRERTETIKQEQRPSGSYVASGAVLFCVRQSDGYYFPAPKSQFAKQDDVEDTLDQCRYICDAAAVDVYSLSDLSLETEEMVSVGERRPYKELPAAFRYREDANFRACDLKRYYDRVAELRARTVTPTNMKNAIIPLPASRPEIAERTSAISEEAQGEAQNASLEKLDTTRQVRMVGPAFFPDE
ncbi:hypothetical protein ASD44_13070 [Mesorhizobium sp. Root554]|uniref:DUF2865 domain-containing protein n=1 Tax=unclassified Mesorhizobium TaxID=325217 RepID=UPI0006FD1977|nr:MULTISPECIES: DUF2865 domain-containing protein [unclassified Mesorhizobium]KQZ14891.1 hypothetical protein ASD27_13075 [Mesorhizobium sp. Root1471]KQZ37400.1 hypothetical protein ASD44_13070 [Mesorhizobium sp. Root554]